MPTEKKGDLPYLRNDLNDNISDNQNFHELSFKSFLLKIAEFYYYLLSKWKILLFSILLGGLLGIGYSFTKKTIYVARCRFVLDESGGNLSQYAGIASMIGIDLGGSANGLFQGDNILELYRSRPMLVKTLFSYATFDGYKELLINKYIQFNEFRKKWENNSRLKGLTFNIQDSSSSRLKDSVITGIVGDINSKSLSVSRPDRKTGIILVEVKAKNEEFAKIFNNLIVKNVNDYYISSKTSKTEQTLRTLEKQEDTIRKSFNNSISGIAENSDANININLARQSLKVPSQLKQANAETSRGILADLVRNIEFTKLSLKRETPLIQLVDWPVYPLEKLDLTWERAFIEVAILFLFLTIFFLIIRKIIRDVLAS